MQCFIQALDSCGCKAMFGHWSCHAKNRLGRHMHIKPTKIKMCMYRGMYTVGLKIMTTYRRVKSVTAGPILT